MDLFPTSNETVANYKEVLDNFNPLDRMYFDINARNTEVSPEELIQVGDQLIEKLRSSDLFRRLSYRWNVDDITATIDVFRNHRAVLFSQSDQKALTEKLSPGELGQTIQNWKRQLIESPAPMLAQMFTQDPIGMDTVLLKKLEGIQSYGESMRMFKGRLFSKDMRHLMILAPPKTSSSDAEFAAKLIEDVEKIISPLESPKIDIAYVGGHRYAVENAVTMQKDIRLASTLSIVAIFILAFLVFSKLSIPVIVILPAVFGVSVAFGSMALFTNSISLVALGCGSIMFGIAVDYGIHILFHLDRSDDKNMDAIISTMTKLVKPIIISAITTLVAFLCLQFSILPSYQQFGQFAAVGILAASFFSLVVTPSFVIDLHKTKRNPRFKIERVFTSYFDFHLKRKFSLFALFLVGTIGLGAGLKNLRFDGDVQNLYAASSALQSDVDKINSAFGDAMSSTSLVTVGTSLEEALQENDRLFVRLQKLKDDGAINSFHSLAPLLPSNQVQAFNATRWQNFWNKNRKAKLNKDLDKLAKAERLNPQVLTNFISTLPGDQPAVSIASYEPSFLHGIFKTQLIQKSESMVLSNVKLKSNDDFEEFFSQVKIDFPNTIGVNGKSFVKTMVRLINDELIRLGSYTLVGLCILLLAIVGIRQGLSVLAPIITSLVWTFGILGWLDVPINAMNCVVILFIFGLVVDYSVFLSFAAIQPAGTEHLAKTGGAVAISALTTLFGVGALALAQHPALHAVGLTVLVGIICGWFCVFVLVPFFRPKNASC